MLKSKAAQIFAALLCVAFVFLVFIKKEANVKENIAVEIYDHDLKKSVKITLSDEDCQISFDLRDRIIRFLENSGKVGAAEIQAMKNVRDFFWILWKFPERHAKLYDGYRAEATRNKPASREIILLQCRGYTESMRQKIEDAEARIKSITREEIEKTFNIGWAVKHYGDDNIKSEKMKEALGQP